LEENFDRFNFAIYKEKEMVDFRRWIIAAAVLTLFVGLASAQVPGGGGTGQLSCTASVAVPPQLRTEGLTELVGDIVLTCTGGTALTNGSVVPTANITVSFGTNVTSRLLATSSLPSSGGPTQNITEALLLIDEPGSGIAVPPPPFPQGLGPQAPQTPCSTGSGPLVGAGPGGCVQVANNIPVNPANPAAGTIPAMSTLGGGAPANLYLGLSNANQVTFQGIPILPPVTAGSTRVFRMTNIRINVNALGGGLLNGVTPAVASVTISGSTSLPLNNPVLNVGFIQPGLTTSFSAAATGNVGQTFLQCTSVALSNANSSNINGGPAATVGFLNYIENFGTAFKTRVAPIGANTTGQTGYGSALQNIPGTIYNSESGFIIPAGSFGNFISTTGGQTTTSNQIGLADYGTRLKAVFNNIPAGVSIYVTLTNVTPVGGGNSATAPGNIAQPAGNSPSSFAQLVNGETTVDGNNSVPLLGVTNSIGSGASSTALALVPQSNGTGTAVWEVINTNPSTNETFHFGVFLTYTANQNAGSPAIGQATVNQSYAPTAGPLTFSATAGGANTASGLTIPRFIDSSGSGRNLFLIQLCQTLLLYPFVTNTNGFDTGLSIANTTTDPVGTPPQAGICKLTWYGTPTIPPTGINGTDLTKEAPVASGTVAVNLASVLAPGFQGYMFAQCNFQLAHGFAFISDLGARNLAMGYLALVVNNGFVVVRPAAPAGESLGN
jgi:hypothetical protein